MNRRDFLSLSGGATAALLAYPQTSYSNLKSKAVKSANGLGSIKIRDIQVAAIQDEYICNLVKITTDDGVYGLGEARVKDLKYIKLIKELKSLVIGENPLRVEYLTRKMMSANLADVQTAMGAISGIETALWDLAGKILNTPSYNLLGGKYHDKVKVYYDLSPADSPKTTDPKAWAECAHSAMEMGFKAMKFDIYRGGGDVPDWAKILNIVRESVGPDIQIGVDFHWRLTPDQTSRFIELVEPANLWFIEDPMKYELFEKDYQRIVTEGKMPIVALEGMKTVKNFHHWIDKGICSIVQADGQYCGGLLELKRAANLGELYGIDTICHNMCTPVGTYAQAHACVTIPSFLVMENACADHIIQHEGSLYEDGYLILHDKPGFGIDLDEDYCRKNLVEGSKFFGN
jgi:L-alanine-DL-glutamate epimerase-like enolase superfamily enzyme